VGAAVGTLVGDVVGTAVGDAVGTGVGDAVGDAVGGVGDDVGASVGAAVGTGVGDAVGDEVGEQVSLIIIRLASTSSSAFALFLQIAPQRGTEIAGQFKNIESNDVTLDTSQGERSPLNAAAF